MWCVKGRGECIGCMECVDGLPVLTSDDGEKIYEGDTYYDIEGMILTEDELEKHKKVAVYEE